MLAMTFLAILLVAIAMTTIQISNIYTKGITLREVNQAGRAISDELQRNINSATPFDVTPKVDASPATSTSKYVVRNEGGRLCLGQYSYIWNYGKAIADGTVYNKYSDDGSAVHFAKVTDPGGSLCDNTVLTIPRDKSSDLLSSGDRDLVLHSFSVKQTASDGAIGQAIYAISMTIGTNQREQLVTNDTSCKPPSEGIGDQDYCSVNQFDIIARAGNKAGGQ